jgi:hypothetical protein
MNCLLLYFIDSFANELHNMKQVVNKKPNPEAQSRSPIQKPNPEAQSRSPI